MDESPFTDELLAEQAQAGDMNAFAELVRRYQQKMIRYGSRFLRGSNDIEDIVQEVMLKAYRNMKSFHTKQRFSPWIYRIAHNAFIDVLKKKHREPLPFFNPDELFPHPVAPDDPKAEVDQSLLREQLDAQLDSLEPKYREPLILRFYDQLSYKEIGDILHIPTGTVSIRLQRGMKQLQGQYRTNKASL